MNREEDEFLRMAQDMEEGRTEPLSFTRKDMYGKEKKYSFAGDIWYSDICLRCKRYTTYNKRSRCYDFIHDYLKKKNFYIHS